jgi:site-specific recombinase XerD
MGRGPSQVAHASTSIAPSWRFSSARGSVSRRRLALFPKDLDPAGGSLRVLHGKGDKARTAPLPSDAAEAVDRWLDCRKRLRLTGRHPLFCTLKGEPLWDSYVRTLCKRLAAKAGIEKGSIRMA